MGTLVEEYVKGVDYANMLMSRFERPTAIHCKIKKGNKIYRAVCFKNHAWYTFEKKNTVVGASLEWLLDNGYTIKR